MSNSRPSIWRKEISKPKYYISIKLEEYTPTMITYSAGFAHVLKGNLYEFFLKFHTYRFRIHYYILAGGRDKDYNDFHLG